KPMSYAGPGFWRRHIPRAVHDKSATNVKIGQTPSELHVKPIEAGNGIAKCIASNGRRTRVNALSPGECSLHLEPVAHALCQLQFHRIVVRTALIKHATNGAVMRVEGIQRVTIGIERPNVTRGGFCGQNQVSLVYPEWLVHASRAD